jgi:hypothetical protein
MTNDIRDDSPETIDGTRAASAYEQVAAWMQANDMSYSENAEQGCFSLHYTCDNADFRIIIDVADEPKGPKLLVFAYFPVRVPEARRAAAADLIARINHSIWLGCLAIDARDGEVSVRTAMPVDDGSFTEGQLEHLFFTTLNLADRRLPGICAVAFGGVAPDVAFEMGQVTAREGLQ